MVDGYPSDREMLKQVASAFGIQVWERFPVLDIQESLQKEQVPKLKSGEAEWQWVLRVIEHSHGRSRTRSASTASNILTQDVLEDE